MKNVYLIGMFDYKNYNFMGNIMTVFKSTSKTQEYLNTHNLDPKLQYRLIKVDLI